MHSRDIHIIIIIIIIIIVIIHYYHYDITVCRVHGARERDIHTNLS